MAKAKARPKTINTYESMFLLGSGFAADLDNAQKLVRGIVEKHEGKVLVIKKWDERKLAYEIRGEKRGLYIVCFFKAPPEGVAGVVRDVELSDQMLRVMVTKADHLNETEMAAVEPQPIIPREERNSWDRPTWEDRPAPRRDSRDSRPPGRPGREESAEAYAKD